MDATMFWQIVAIVTYALLLSTVLSIAICAYVIKMYPKMVAAMMEAMGSDEETFDDAMHRVPDLSFPPSLTRE
jgi:hypothetical protein